MNFFILVVDDEPLSCNRVKRLLQGDRQIARLEIADNAQTALKIIRGERPDLVFLDIEMPGMNGFEMLQQIPEKKRPYIIFITAYEEYAVRAFNVQAVDYLLKPFSRPRFNEAMQRARIFLDRGEKPELKEYPNRLAVKNAEEVIFVKISDIDWIEAQGRNVILHAGARSHLMREGISVLAGRLDPAKFARIHRSHIVNLDRVVKMQPLFHGDFRITLTDGTKLVLSRGHKEGLRTILGNP